MDSVAAQLCDDDQLLLPTTRAFLVNLAPVLMMNVEIKLRRVKPSRPPKRLQYCDRTGTESQLLPSIGRDRHAWAGRSGTATVHLRVTGLNASRHSFFVRLTRSP